MGLLHPEGEGGGPAARSCNGQDDVCSGTAWRPCTQGTARAHQARQQGAQLDRRKPQAPIPPSQSAAASSPPSRRSTYPCASQPSRRSVHARRRVTSVRQAPPACARLAHVAAGHGTIEWAAQLALAAPRRAPGSVGDRGRLQPSAHTPCCACCAARRRLEPGALKDCAGGERPT